MPTDWTLVYRIVLISGAALVVVAFVLGKFYRLNRNLHAEIARRRVLEAELQRQSLTDAVTGLLNRRGFTEALRREVARAVRHGRPLAVLTLDFDNFKRVNDTYGHAAGDRALETVAAACRHALRSADAVGRVGGDEFLIAMPETDLDAACQAAERIRATVEATVVPLPDGSVLAVTTSVGVALLQQDEAIDAVLARSDQAVYDAKRRGRNRVAASRV